MRGYKKIAIISLCFSLLIGCSKEAPGGVSFHGISVEEQNELARTMPLEPYGETVEYTLAKLTGVNNMPAGDTYENNAITRCLYEKLNIRNKDVLEAAGDEYNNKIDVLIASNKLPDVMVLTDYSDLEYLVEHDMIEDLTESYNNCATDKIKHIYRSYGKSILENVTFNGKIMALPETNIDHGPNLLWLRKDWIDKLGLKEPSTKEDVEQIIEAFVKNDVSGKGTTGIMINKKMVGELGYDNEYSLESVFALFNAYPKNWIEKDDKIVYGSVTDEARDALLYIRGLFDRGIIDRNFLLRDIENIREEIVKGRCGSFYGPWWAANNPLIDAIKEDPAAEWKCYLISPNGDGQLAYYTQAPSYKYVVVRKGYEHPEIVFKMTSVQFDYMRFKDNTNEEVNLYERNNIDQTARPLSINVDYSAALVMSHDNISAVLNGEISADQLVILDATYAKACLDYLNPKVPFKAEDWAAYTSRITATALIKANKNNKKQKLFFGQTKTMRSDWWKLEQLENTSYIEFIIGEKDIETEWDDFVDRWNRLGGEQITKEVVYNIRKKEMQNRQQ